jgi:hypothetical protein
MDQVELRPVAAQVVDRVMLDECARIVFRMVGNVYADDLGTGTRTQIPFRCAASAAKQIENPHTATLFSPTS